MLDIDLDFFLSEITWLPADHMLRQDARVVPWSEREVREFLENQCKLSASNPKPGEIVTTHDQVFERWKSLMEQNRLLRPFELVHVDAHADMGLGWGSTSTAFICTELLSHPVDQRVAVAFKGFDEGSYLAFAVACGWISKFCYVHHPGLNLPNGDIPPAHLKGFEQNAAALQLKRYRTEDLDANHWRYEKTMPVALEPEIPFRRVSHIAYAAERSPDFVFVAQSPLYTPKSADTLLQVIRAYVHSG